MQNSTTAQLLAREYRRLSDRKGGTSLEDQGEDNAAARDEHGWGLGGPPYIDDGISASRYARKRRNDFEQLIADLRSGPTGRTSAFGADIIQLWESSRGSRKVGEWANFIDLCEEKGVFIWVTTHERLYNPANGRDRKTLLEDAIDSEYESYKTHVRVTRTAPKEARRGRPHGRAPEGLKAVYDPATGKLLTWVEDPERSHIPKELFDRLEKGDSLNAVERRFGELEYRNQSGNPYGTGQLRGMALRHAYAGLRYYRGTVYKGIWDGLVTPDQFWTVYRLITSPERARERHGRAVHTLTAGLNCGRCSGRYNVIAAEGRKAVYRCDDCGMKIEKAGLDQLLIGTGEQPGVLLKFLARKDVHAELYARDSKDPEVQKARGELAQAQADLDATKAAEAESLAEERRLARREERLEEQVQALQERLRQLTLPSAVLRMVRPGADVWNSWQQASVSARRQVVRALFVPDHLGKIVIQPSPTRGRHQPIGPRVEFQREEPPSA